MSATRWQSERSAGDSRAYIERFAELAHAGTDLHGEARLVDVLVPRGARILDAGCGTGRVGLELARRGHSVTAVDLDPVLVEEARAHPELTVHLADLAQLDLPGERFDAVVSAGNVMVFLAPGSERTVLERIATHLRPGGVFVAGFTTGAAYRPSQFAADLAAAGLSLEHRFATWDLRPWHDDAEWLVAVARRGDGRGATATT
ncbi:methyltransferase domain-containing protein [Rhodococcus sp. YH1]|uniref:methyltransferase domain-containing protein n=1 Tax=Rhodococcus sp. YH1 TaxID=89066 RepID=UPI00192E650A|nr:Ubiquinone biosynthesis O-methyltransferase [Rhodococcus sp. YH1]